MSRPPPSVPLVAPPPAVASGVAGSAGSRAGSCAGEAGAGEGAPRALERLLEIAGEDVALVPLTSPPLPTRSTGRGWREDARRAPPSRDVDDEEGDALQAGATSSRQTAEAVGAAAGAPAAERIPLL